MEGSLSTTYLSVVFPTELVSEVSTEQEKRKPVVKFIVYLFDHKGTGTKTSIYLSEFQETNPLV